MNGAIFKAWIEQMLAPALQPGDIVVMDNLPAHKGGWNPGSDRSSWRGAALPPPYSPDLNPSGAARPSVPAGTAPRRRRRQAFAKLREPALRRAFERTVERALERHRQAARAVPPPSAPTTSSL